MADKKGDKLTSKQKEVLKVQRSLLSRNIVWTSALAARLKERRLLSDAMIAQIDATQGRENQILALLDLLPLRTTQVYDKFADALHLSGHALLADFLRDEDVAQHPLNVDDLFDRLPFLPKDLKDTDRGAIEDYMLEKIQGCVLSQTWGWNTKDKDKALVSKMEQVEEAFRHKEEMTLRQQKVLEAERLAKLAREETLATKAELQSVTDNASRLQHHMRGQMDTQMRFSVANDNMAQRLTQRLKTAEQTLKSVQDALQTVVRLPPRDQERDLMKLAENAYHFLPEDAHTFVAQFQKLRHLQTEYEKLAEECSSILSDLGFPSSTEEVSVLRAYQDFAHRKEEELQLLQREVTRQEQLVQDVTKAKQEEHRKLATAGTVWQNAIMSVMRKQLQDLKTTVRKKDTTIIIKEEEISKLRGKVTDLEQTLDTKTKERNHVMRTLKLIELESNTTNPTLPPDITTLQQPDNTTTTKTQTFPPLTSSSPRPGVRRSHHHQRGQHVHSVALPGGLVVEADTKLEMYPAGLSTVPLVASRDDTSRGGPLPAADPKSRSGMRSTLGDLRSMHAHSKYVPPSRGGGGGFGLDSLPAANHGKVPVSRGGGGGGGAGLEMMPPASRGNGGGMGLDHPGYPGKKRMTSPSPKRKFAARVK